METTGNDFVVLGIHAEQSSLPNVTPHYETRDPGALELAGSRSHGSRDGRGQHVIR